MNHKTLVKLNQEPITGGSVNYLAEERTLLHDKPFDISRSLYLVSMTADGRERLVARFNSLEQAATAEGSLRHRCPRSIVEVLADLQS